MRKLTNHDLKQALRTKYAWPGGYEIFGITSDGSALCCDCMRENFRSILWSKKHDVSDGWQVDAVVSAASIDSKDFIDENTDKYSLTQCDHCTKILNG